MAVEDIVTPRRETSFTYKKNNETEEFIVREPTPDEMNLCDIFRSKVWYSCMKQGIATEEEILEMLKNQGRFNNDKFMEKLKELTSLTGAALEKMAMVNNEEELEEAYKEAAACRKKELEHNKKRAAFTRHSVEVRADHAYNMALMGICVEKRNGKQVFAAFDDLGNIDIDKTFEKTEGWKDVAFVNAALTVFLPFMMGFADGKPKHAEDLIYETILSRFKNAPSSSKELDEELETEISAESEDKVVVEAPKAKVEVPQPKPKTEVAKPKEEKIEEPEVKEEVASDSDPLDMEAPSFEPTQPKTELVHANNRPRMSPAPTSERMSIKAGQKAATAEEEEIDATQDRAGFRTGDEDTDYGDGSAMPLASGPIRTVIPKRQNQE